MSRSLEDLNVKPNIYRFICRVNFTRWNLGTFNNIFGFSPSMDLSNRQVPCEFNSNAFWGELLGSVRYSTSSLKCTHIINPCIRVAQRILACSLFIKLRLAIYVGFSLGTGFYRFPVLTEPPYFIAVTFIGFLVMRRLFNPYPIIKPLTLVKQDLVHPLNHPSWLYWHPRHP